MLKERPTIAYSSEETLQPKAIMAHHLAVE
jgi:hypothetical protein